jgi:hypothetical protein
MKFGIHIMPTEPIITPVLYILALKITSTDASQIELFTDFVMHAY